MPIYEFVCGSCGNEFEKIVSFSATSTPSCPSCRADDVSRRLSPPAIHFKGSGWYITDSKSSNGKNGAGKSKSGDGESTSKAPTSDASDAGTKNESKSESKSEAKSTTANDGSDS